MRRIDVLHAINKGRVRKIGYNKMICTAIRLGIFETDSKNFNKPERAVSVDKLTYRDRDLIKQQYKKGTSTDRILTVINSTKDIKISVLELDKFINDNVLSINKTKKQTIFSDQERHYITKNTGKSIFHLAFELNKSRNVKVSPSAVKRYMIKEGLFDNLVKTN
jgi:hypothetical protein